MSGVQLVVSVTPPSKSPSGTLLSGLWDAAASVLGAIEGAPMGIGTAARLLLLMRIAVQTVKGYDALVERAKHRFSNYAQALLDIDKL
jgi:hypothetical protein